MPSFRCENPIFSRHEIVFEMSKSRVSSFFRNDFSMKSTSEAMLRIDVLPRFSRITARKQQDLEGLETTEFVKAAK
jgi:hypothetical protein